MMGPDRGSEAAIDPEKRMEELAPVLKALPKGTHVACIQEGDALYLYNISRALELFAARRATTSIDVAEYAKQVQPRDAATPREDGAFIDPGHAATVDLSFPVMLLENPGEMGGRQGQVIDGWHRIYRAAQLGIAELPAVVIAPEEAELVRIDPGPIQR